MIIGTPSRTLCQSHQNLAVDSVTGLVVQAGSIQQVVLPAGRPNAVPVPQQLPPVLPDFTGRDGPLTALDELLPSVEDSPGAATIAVIDGAGGIGKTTLVVYWAHRLRGRFLDGTLFINLRGYGPSAPLDPAVVLASEVSAIGPPCHG